MVGTYGTTSGSYITNRISTFSQKDQTAPSVIFGIGGCNRKQSAKFDFKNLFLLRVSLKPARAYFEFLDLKVKLKQINFLFVHQYT